SPNQKSVISAWQVITVWQSLQKEPRFDRDHQETQTSKTSARQEGIGTSREDWPVMGIKLIKGMKGERPSENAQHRMSAREYMNRRYGSAYTEPLDKWVEWTKGTAKPLKSEGTFDLQVWQTFLHDYGPLLCSEGTWRIACTWETEAKVANQTGLTEIFNKSTAQIYYVWPEDSVEDPPPYVAASLALRGPSTKELDYIEHTKDELCNIVESRGLTAPYQPTRRILARILETDDLHMCLLIYAKLDLSELKALAREREIESELPEQTIISKLWQQDEERRKGDTTPSAPGTEQSVAVYPVRTQLVFEGNAVDSKSQIKWHVPFSPQDMRAILEGLGDPRKNPIGFANKLSAAQEAYEASY
ncbi:hypothetical protein AB205_0122080, partial [Aquarana catesbeiana]